MRSFTATCHLGDVKVQLPDDGPPIVWLHGKVIAQSVPCSVPGYDLASLAFPSSSELDVVTVTPSGQRANRVARSIRRPIPLGHVPDGQIEERKDVAVVEIRGAFAPEGWPVLWGARVDERNGRVRGFTFEDGVQTLEVWEIDLVPVRRKCCGQR